MKKEMILSTLPKTWILDLDGTILKHNGYKDEGYDTLICGVKEFLSSIPLDDKIIILTARTNEYKKQTLDYLVKNGVRFDEILFNMPVGERIVVNDRKNNGLEMAIAINIDRDKFELPDFSYKK